MKAGHMDGKATIHMCCWFCSDDHCWVLITELLTDRFRLFFQSVCRCVMRKRTASLGIWFDIWCG